MGEVKQTFAMEGFGGTIFSVIEARGSRPAIMRAYNLFSFFYSRTIARMEREAVNEGLARAQVRPGECVLEVGVGTGHVSALLGQSVGPSGRLIGVDIALRMLAVAHHRVADIRLVQADARALPFLDEFFDLVWSSYLLDLIPTGDLAPLLREFRRVLKPGGRLVLVNFSKNCKELTGWERAYRLMPSWLVPYLFGGCRPVEAEPFVREAEFGNIERRFVPGRINSEIIVAWN